MQRATLQRITHLFLAVVFVTAAQGQALGVRHCSLHDAVPVVPTQGSDHAGSEAGSHAQPGSHHHGGAPGSCMDDCQAGSSFTGIGSGTVATGLTAPWIATGPVDQRAATFGPRHDPYELHFPTGPPLSA